MAAVPNSLLVVAGVGEPVRSFWPIKKLFKKLHPTVTAMCSDKNVTQKTSGRLNVIHEATFYSCSASNEMRKGHVIACDQGQIQRFVKRGAQNYNV